MNVKHSQAELEAYLDEALSPSEMAAIEQSLRAQPELTQELAAVNGRRDAGIHTIGAIWRRHRVSCPTREQLGSYLLQATAPELRTYIQFHLEVVGCRFCLANLDDLERQQAEAADIVNVRRNKYFQSSAGYFRSE